MKRLAHKISLLSTVILVLLLALPVVALADGGKGENEFTKTVSGYQITLVFEKVAVVGSNPIHIRVNDAQNMPITNGDVEVSVVKGESEHAEMADMPGMAEVSPSEHAEMGMTRLAVGHHSEEYTGEIAIETAGDYVIRVHLTVQGELTEVDFPLNVAQSQNGSGILAVFFAVNVAIIAGAVILKPKPVSIKSSKGA
jgi:hypothetical protein